MKSRKAQKTDKAVLTSNIMSTLTGTAAACCAGPGLFACSTACAPTCGSLGFSVFGLSSMVFTNWINQYWYLFIVASILSFSFAFYKLYIKTNCNSTRRSKIIFLSCLVVSIIFIVKSFLNC